MAKAYFPHPPSLPLVLVIDLDAVAHNYHTLSARVRKGVICAAVLKANAYGMGVREVATRLYHEGCRHFFLAQISEAIELKTFVGEDASIYVLNGIRRGEEEVYAHYELIPVLGDPLQIHLWNSFCQTKNQSLKAVLHCDTGLIRTGLSERAMEGLGLLQVSHMEIVCIMSHMACAYHAPHPMNEVQRMAFKDLKKRFPFALFSFSSSGALFLDESYHFDMIRAGIALTGCRSAIPHGEYTLKPVLKAYAQVLQITEIPQGTSVGYNATFIASRASRIATIGVGYADGYLRSLSNQGEVYFEGYKLPVVGCVSMDLTTIDITDLPPNKIGLGSWVELFGDHLWASKVAEKAGTVSWELYTRLGSRFERFYLDSAEKSRDVA
ncbi:MAG: alanine racemase [Alphaproteobacteria bacterium]|nr:alanine racemase [Alphaproteobacteria bacterium]